MLDNPQQFMLDLASLGKGIGAVKIPEWFARPLAIYIACLTFTAKPSVIERSLRNEGIWLMDHHVRVSSRAIAR